MGGCHFLRWENISFSPLGVNYGPWWLLAYGEQAIFEGHHLAKIWSLALGYARDWVGKNDTYCLFGVRDNSESAYREEYVGWLEQNEVRIML